MKEHVKKLTESEARKNIQTLTGTEKADKEHTAAKAQEEDNKKTRSRSTTPGGTRKETIQKIFKTHEEKIQWHAERRDTSPHRQRQQRTLDP